MFPSYISSGLCELSLNPSSMGLWTVYQEHEDNLQGLLPFYLFI